MPQEIKVGSVVRLKSGSPSMTVTAVHESGMMAAGPVHAYCTWFDGNKVVTGDFPLEAVEIDE